MHARVRGPTGVGTARQIRIVSEGSDDGRRARPERTGSNGRCECAVRRVRGDVRDRCRSGSSDRHGRSQRCRSRDPTELTLNVIVPRRTGRTTLRLEVRRPVARDRFHCRIGQRDGRRNRELESQQQCGERSEAAMLRACLHGQAPGIGGKRALHRASARNITGTIAAAGGSLSSAGFQSMRN